MVVADVGLFSFSSCIPSLSPPPPRLRFSFTRTKRLADTLVSYFKHILYIMVYSGLVLGLPCTSKLQLTVASMSDDPVREWILSEGKATQITGIRSVGGGCINRASRYDTDAGSFFVKTNRSIGPSMFEGEALGLNAMYETRSIRVPKPFKVGPLPTGGSYIIMEFIEFGASWGYQSALGRKLAEMHKAAKSEKGFGFDVDNTIGSTPQINTWTSDWIEFYGVHRLGYQLKLARQQFGDSLIYEKGQRLVKNMAPLFDGAVIEPCLCMETYGAGISALTKMAILSFLIQLATVMPKQPGFEQRRDLYMLYHYLNHYNLFGSGYRSSAMSIIDDYLRMLKPQRFAEATLGKAKRSWIDVNSSSTRVCKKISETESTNTDNGGGEGDINCTRRIGSSSRASNPNGEATPHHHPPSQLLQIHATLHSAHHRLSLFLSHHHPPTPTPPHHPQSTILPPENSVSSAVGGGGHDDDEGGEGEPMQVGDDEDEQDSRAATTVEKVEERMRECFIQNKRPKRQLSPSAAEQWRSYENYAAAGEFDPVGTKLRSLGLVYQFHA
ncbi:UNVERIFIED_CONTAM: Protein-ribulosamine 3-kinase, chloroplastic [Sesamum calycinum]